MASQHPRAVGRPGFSGVIGKKKSPLAVRRDWQTSLPADTRYRIWCLRQEGRQLSRVHEFPEGRWVLLLMPSVSLSAHLSAVLESISKWPARDKWLRVVMAVPADRQIAPKLPVWVEPIRVPEDGAIPWHRIDATFVAIMYRPGRVSLLAPMAWKLAMAHGAPDIMYGDVDCVQGNVRQRPHFKPQFSPEMLPDLNLFDGLTVYRKAILERIAPWPRDDHALALAAAPLAARIHRIPYVLFHELVIRNPSMSVRQPAASYLPLKDYRTVRIIIPTRDNGPILRQCMDGLALTDYPAFRITVVDNGTRDPASLRELARIDALGLADVQRDDRPFNFSALNNQVVRSATEDIIVFLNDDTQVITPGWLTHLVAALSAPEIGAAGPLLLYPNRRIQHAGVVIGIRGLAAHAFRMQPVDEPGYHAYPHIVRNCSALTGACLAVKREVFVDVGGFDEQFAISFNDIDLCLRIGERGYRMVYTPHAQLYHYESVSRGKTIDPGEVARFLERWSERIRQGDPYYSPNLTTLTEDFTPNWQVPD